MKRYIRATTIYGMSIDRSKAVQRLEKFGELFHEHICKCVLYGDSLHCYNHWIGDELANWLSQVNNTTLRGNKKLKAADYRNRFLGQFSKDWEDAEASLVLFAAQNKDQYPEVNTDAYIKCMHDVSCELIDKLPSLLASSNDLGQRLFAEMLHSILDYYCIIRRR